MHQSNLDHYRGTTCSVTASAMALVLKYSCLYRSSCSGRSLLGDARCDHGVFRATTHAAAAAVAPTRARHSARVTAPPTSGPSAQQAQPLRGGSHPPSREARPSRPGEKKCAMAIEALASDWPLARPWHALGLRAPAAAPEMVRRHLKGVVTRKFRAGGAGARGAASVRPLHTFSCIIATFLLHARKIAVFFCVCVILQTFFLTALFFFLLQHFCVRCTKQGFAAHFLYPAGHTSRAGL